MRHKFLIYRVEKSALDLKIDGVASARLENKDLWFGIIGKMVINRVI